MPYSKAISAAACVLAVFGVTLQAATAQTAGRTAGYNVDRNAYFGDLHVHTRLSFDAYIFNVRASPEDAYRYARGESLKHALGYDIRLTDAPLDFLAVTDHSEYLGVLQAMDDPQHPLSKVPYARAVYDGRSEDRRGIPAHRRESARGAVPARNARSRNAQRGLAIGHRCRRAQLRSRPVHDVHRL